MLIGHRDRLRGFTLLEMMIAVTIFAILVVLAVPAMTTWIRNSKVRAVADNLQNGLRLAQAESLRRSRRVVFSLTNSTSPQNGGFTAAANGQYWSINVIPSMTDGSDAAASSAAAFVQSGVVSATSGSGITVAGPASVCFNSVGRVAAVPAASIGIAGATCTPPASNATVYTYAVAVTGADRPMSVQLALGGQVHLCTTGTTLSSSNPDGC